MKENNLFDDVFIENVLKIYDFCLDDLDVSKINYVHMNDYKFSSTNKSCLLTFNLQCCVAVYLYGNGFGFLAHINTAKGNLSPAFFDLKSNRFLLSDLVLEMLKQYCEYSGNWNGFNIGMITGSSPYSSDYYIMQSISCGINEFVKEAALCGIILQVRKEINCPDFVFDTMKEEIICPKCRIKLK